MKRLLLLGVLLASPAHATVGIWTTKAELMQLARDAKFNVVRGAANTVPAGDGVGLGHQDSKWNTVTLARAYMYALTDSTHYRDSVRVACATAIGTQGTGTNRTTLSAGRELAAYVIAADLVGLETSADVTFRAWLDTVTTCYISGRGGQNSMVATMMGSPNNHGAMCGASVAAVARYLGNDGLLDFSARVLKGYLGDRAWRRPCRLGEVDSSSINALTPHCFKFDSTVYNPAKSWSSTPDSPVEINPRGATKGGYSIDGAQPEEMRRGGDFKARPTQTDYVWEGLQGLVTWAHILYRAGYTDVWAWSDSALSRATHYIAYIDALYPSDGWWASGDDVWVPHLINSAYDGKGFETEAEVPTTHGKIMAWTSFTHQNSLTTIEAVRTYYVAPDSAGSNTGADSANAISLSRANTIAAPGTKFLLTAGTYPVAITPANGGTGKGADSAVVYHGYPCAQDALNHSATWGWGACDSASGAVVVPGATITTQSYVSIRGVKFSAAVSLAGASATEATAQHDSVSWCTVVKTGGSGGYGASAIVATQVDNAVFYRNRITRVQSATTNGSDHTLHFDHDPRTTTRTHFNTGLVVRRNRIYISTLGNCPSCNDDEDRGIVFRHWRQVTFDSNRVEANFKNSDGTVRPPSRAETMVLYYATVGELDSKDNRFDIPCYTQLRMGTTDILKPWVFGWIRDYMGMEPVAGICSTCGVYKGTGHPTVIRGTPVRFLRDSVFTCTNNDSISAVWLFPGGNSDSSHYVYMDSCVVKINNNYSVGEYGSVTVRNGMRLSRFRGNVIVNRHSNGRAIVIVSGGTPGSLEALEMTNNTLYGGLFIKPWFAGDYADGSLPLFTGNIASKFKWNIFYKQTTSTASNTGPVVYTWFSGPGPGGSGWAPRPDWNNNLYYSGSNVANQAVGWYKGGGLSASGVSTVGGGCVPATPCWYEAQNRPYDERSKYTDPQFVTVNADSFWGDVRCNGWARIRGYGAKTGSDHPLAFIATDSTQTQTSITLRWQMPRDSVTKRQLDNLEYTIFISRQYPDTVRTSYGGYFTNDVEWPSTGYRGDFRDVIKRVENVTDLTVQTHWKRGKTSSLTFDAPSSADTPPTRWVRALVDNYWNIDADTGTNALTTNTKYFFVVQARDRCSGSVFYTPIDSWACAFTDDVTPGGVPACAE